MAENSKIEWTDHTFNPWRGCTKVAPGCANCYADTLSKRNPGTLGVWGPNGSRVVASEAMWREPVKWDREAKAAGKRARVFCASLADVFEDWPNVMRGPKGGYLHHAEAWQRNDGKTYFEIAEIAIGKSRVTMADVRRRLFTLIDATPNLDWLLLTKRPENILEMWPPLGCSDMTRPLRQILRRKNVWLGTSVSDQASADKQIPDLLRFRDLAPVLFLSVEPLLGPMDLRNIGVDEWDSLHGWKPHAGPEGSNTPCIDWVIAGGESGPNARPMHPDWVSSLRDQCTAAEAPFFFKQWGENLPFEQIDTEEQRRAWSVAAAAGHQSYFGARVTPGPQGMKTDVTPGIRPASFARIGKEAAGRMLDGRTWDEMPKEATCTK